MSHEVPEQVPAPRAATTTIEHPHPPRAEADTPRHAGGSRARARRRWAWAGAGALLLAALGAGAWLLVDSAWGAPTARVLVGGGTDREVITVTGGALDLQGLQDGLERGSHDGLLVPGAGGALELRADLVVGRGADLELSAVPLLLRSDAGRSVRVTVRDGGHLLLDRATVVSWSGTGVDADPADGRPSVVATGEGSRLDVRRSEVSHLGTGASDPGLSWRNGAAGSLVDTTVTANVRGADSTGGGALVVEGATLEGSLQEGLSLQDPGPGTSVDSSAFEGNGGDGLVVRNADHLELTGLRLRDNGATGLTVAGASSVTVHEAVASGNAAEGLLLDDAVATVVTGSTSWANATGITVSGGEVGVEDAVVSGNVADGVLVTGSGTRATLTRVRADHNDRAGLWLAGSSATVTASVFDRNDTGVRVDDDGQLVARDNTFVDSVRDALSLSGPDNPGITGNTITDSRLAAFSVPAEADLEALEAVVARNALRGDQEATRVREGESTDS